MCTHVFKISRNDSTKAPQVSVTSPAHGLSPTRVLPHKRFNTATAQASHSPDGIIPEATHCRILSKKLKHIRSLASQHLPTSTKIHSSKPALSFVAKLFQIPNHWK